MGRSKLITGPYMDRLGKPMTEGNGTPLIAAYGEIVGPGHCGVLLGECPWYDLLVHHVLMEGARDGRATRDLQVRPIFWAPDGWPLAGEVIQQTPPAPPKPLEGWWSHRVGFGDVHRILFRGNGTLHLEGGRQNPHHAVATARGGRRGGCLYSPSRRQQLRGPQRGRHRHPGNTGAGHGGSHPMSTVSKKKAPPLLPPEAHGRPEFSPLWELPDPTISKDGDWYYVYATGQGIEARRSRNLIDWEVLPSVFPDPVPAWAKEKIPGADSIWAPDIRKIGNRWHLHYSVSTLGSQKSVLGLATAEALDPAHPKGGWKDQ
ncbi:MAG: hypothetical protein EBT30_09630, partial [Verrucomicrobia bacterium]|nr:hypothetical protein [Verrucomicrobiota bacterium]